MDVICENAQPILGSPDDFATIRAAIRETDARFVLIGEASHGTHEFYRDRAILTQQLIEQHGFCGVIVEADWPDAYRVNRYVRGCDDDPDARSALDGFQRFPQWMWRNDVVVSFVEWLRLRNTEARGETKCGFYGMDLYSLHASIRAVLDYLQRADPEAARRAQSRYACFEHFGENAQRYGMSASNDADHSCEDEVVRQLRDMVEHAAAHARAKLDGRCHEDEQFFAEQNARLVKNAEHYYRTMFSERISSWNIRDSHMTETIQTLVSHLDESNQRSETKVIVWAHNSHLGDARATDMGRAGEHNVGRLMRERFGERMFNIGFTTHAGTVTASTDWDGPAELKRVRESLPDSIERLFHDTGIPNFALVMRGNRELTKHLRETRLQRAIGVIYRPRTERMSHYFDAELSEQFDAIIHHDITRAVTPLEHWALKHDREAPETYPSGV